MYQKLMEKSDKCFKKCLECRRNGNGTLAVFYWNASKGFEEKARALTVGEA